LTISDTRPVYLRANVQVDPLFNRWYAWAHLVAPATAAMNVAHSHLRIMRSYAAAPQAHAAAVANPTLRGGPFMDFGRNRAAEVAALVAHVEREQASLLEFAEALQQLSALLGREGAGYSLEPLYQKIPAPLRGFVELTYDLSSQPSFRLIEPLLYRSRWYRPELQSLSLSLIERDERPFVFSTPMLDDNGLQLRWSFADRRLDQLFALRRKPQVLGELLERFGLAPEQFAALRPLLQLEQPPTRHEPVEDGVRIRYFGHACVLIESHGVSVLTDPVISYDYPAPGARYTAADLPPKIDYVLISHGHSDHLMFETMLQLRAQIGTVVVPRSNGSLQDPSLALALRNTGFARVIEASELSPISIEQGEIVPLPFLGEHADLAIAAKSGYLVRLRGRSVVLVADSNNLTPELYELLHEVTGDVDVLFLGMECDGAPLTWLYGQLLAKPVDRKMDGSRRLSASDCQRGMAIVRALRSRQVMVYAMGQEPWLGYVTSIKYAPESRPIVESDKLLAACAAAGVPALRPYGRHEMWLSAVHE
jgi:L-ascorbate metabolism protein UlaG (beta-lactamase superfamily)